MYIEALIPCIVHILVLHSWFWLGLAEAMAFLVPEFHVFREFQVFRLFFRKREIHEKHKASRFFQGGPCRSSEGPDRCATLCFTHFRSEIRKHKKHEKHTFFRNAIGREMAQMMFGGSGALFLRPSKIGNLSFSKKSENAKKRVFISLPCVLAHFGIPWIFGVLQIGGQKRTKRPFSSTRFF